MTHYTPEESGADDEIEIMARCLAVFLAKMGGAAAIPRSLTDDVEDLAIVVTTNPEQTMYYARLVTADQAHEIAAERGLVEKDIQGDGVTGERRVTRRTKPSKKEMN
jgi:hypothetical protein